MSKQLQLFSSTNKTAFGGSLLKNSHAKTARPFSPKASMHIVLKANTYVLKYYDRRVELLIEKQARKQLIKIYAMQNVGNHIHLVLRAKNKVILQNFLRSIGGLIPRLLGQANLWVQRPFSRIIRWGRSFKTIKNYMTLNHYEANGYTKMQARCMLEMDQGLIDLDAG
jgi:hypothetical protein